MKKTFLTAFAALLVAIPAVQAQKVNKSGLLTKIEKSDADIADAKKNAKASTWINRGKALYEAAVEPTKSLFVNMDAAMLKLAVGEPSATKQVTLLNVPYEAWEYPYFIAYIKDGKVVTWTQTDWVLKEAPAMAIEAYNKAYEIDPKSAAKVKDGLQQISDFCSQVGNTGIGTVEPRLRRSRRSRAALLCRLPAHSGRFGAPLVVRTGCRVPQEGDRPGLYRRGG